MTFDRVYTTDTYIWQGCSKCFLKDTSVLCLQQLSTPVKKRLVLELFTAVFVLGVLQYTSDIYDDI